MSTIKPANPPQSSTPVEPSKSSPLKNSNSINYQRRRNSLASLGSINNLFNQNNVSQSYVENSQNKRYIRKKRKFLFWSWTVKVLTDDDKYADQSVKSDSSLISKMRKKCKRRK